MSSCPNYLPSCVSSSLSSLAWSWFPHPLWSVALASLPCRFRYFTLPIVLLVCLVKPKAHPILSMILSGSLNGIVIYLFVFRPFTWGDGSVARFMWCAVCLQRRLDSLWEYHKMESIHHLSFTLIPATPHLHWSVPALFTFLFPSIDGPKFPS